MTMSSLAQVLLSGLQIGCIYSLMALGFYIILSATGILNFAQGEWMMLSGVFGVSLLAMGVPYALALPISIALAVVVALLCERLIIRPLQRRHAQNSITLLAVFGIMLVARYGTGIVHGRLDEPLAGPIGNGVIRLGADIFVFRQSLVIYGTTAVIFMAMTWFVRSTWIGRSLRVAAIDPLAASLVGVDLDRVRLAAFGLGALIAAIVAWLYAPLFAVGYMTGIIPGIKGFIALFIGGMGSPLGALCGGLLLGLLEVTASRYLPSIYSEGIAFVLLMAILVLRPSGILKDKGMA